MSKLDDRGFMFIDLLHRVVWCRNLYGSPWLLRWNEKTQEWITMQEISDIMAEAMRQTRRLLSDKERSVYPTP